MKRSVAAALLCVTIAGCSATSNAIPTGASSTPAPTPPATLRSVATALAASDGNPAHGRSYLAPVRTITKFCRLASPGPAIGFVDDFEKVLRLNHLSASFLTVTQALAGAARHQPSHCGRTFAAYVSEIAGTGPAKTSSGWGGYAGSVTAWDAVHHGDPHRPGQYLPRRHALDAYQLLPAGQVTSLVERFDPPVSAKLALAQIVHDLLPGRVHSAYVLNAAQCQQAIYLGSQLGGLLHSASLGAFVELTSGGGVGHTPYDDEQVDRARITPLGAIGGEPCT